MRPLALLLLAATAASAQPMWRTALGGASVSLDVLKPFDQTQVATDERGVEIGTFRPSPFQSAQVLSARIPVAPRLALVADLPTAYVNYGPPSEAVQRAYPGVDLDAPADFVVGNPYLGLEAQVRPDVAVEAGVRLPVSPRGEFGAGSDAAFAGFTALFEVPEAFLERTTSASVGVRYEPTLARSVRLRLRAVPTVLAYSSFRGVVSGGELLDREEVRETVWALRYGAHVVGSVGLAELSAGVVGRVDDVEPFARTTYVGTYEPTILTLGATVAGLPVRPGLTARVPLRGEPFGTDVVVGLSLDVPIR